MVVVLMAVLMAVGRIPQAAVSSCGMQFFYWQEELPMRQAEVDRLHAVWPTPLATNTSSRGTPESCMRSLTTWTCRGRFVCSYLTTTLTGSASRCGSPPRARTHARIRAPNTYAHECAARNPNSTCPPCCRNWRPTTKTPRSKLNRRVCRSVLQSSRRLRLRFKRSNCLTFA
jgi:hypothetical protein